MSIKKTDISVSLWKLTNLSSVLRMKQTAHTVSTHSLAVSAISPKVSKKKRKTQNITKNPTPKALDANSQGILRTTARVIMIPEKGVIRLDKLCKLDKLPLMHEKTTANIKDLVVDSLFEGEADGIDPFDYTSGVVCDSHHFPKKQTGAIVRDRSSVVDRLKKRNIQIGIDATVKHAVVAGTMKELSSEGIDNLNSKCSEAAGSGVNFVIWRAIYMISETTPSRLTIENNAKALALVASICQSYILVPLLSIEMRCVNNKQTLTINEQCRILELILSSLVKALLDYKVYHEGLLISLSPICSPTQKEPEAACAMLKAINNSLPPAIAGILLKETTSFESTINILNHLNKASIKRPFFITFFLGNSLFECFGTEVHDVKHMNELVDQRVKLGGLASMGMAPEKHKSLFLTNISIL